MQAKHIGSEASSARAVIYGGVVYLPAIVSDEDSLTPGDQTSAILKSIDKLLEESGTSKRRMLTATVFCADARLFDEVNARWDAWVPWHDPPACTFLVARLAGPRKRVAIQVTTAL
jgi:enamine deaminase RidA (YjgF/YER057c/UK114 family)